MSINTSSKLLINDTLGKHHDLTDFGLKMDGFVESGADAVIREMMGHIRQQNLRSRKALEYQLLTRKGQHPASIKGFPHTPPSEKSISDVLDGDFDENQTRTFFRKKHEKKCHFVEYHQDKRDRSFAYCPIKKCKCKQAGCDLKYQTDLDRTQRFDYYPLNKKDFTIPGMGDPGNSCCSVDNERIAEFSEDLTKLRTHRIVCRRVECPSCYRLWIKSRALEISLALEIASFFRGERPYSMVASIRPNEMYINKWTWKNVNHSLFNRAYRRGNNVGIDGGFVFFHPFRVRKKIKKKLRSYRSQLSGREFELSDGDVGFWRMIRKDVLGLGDFYDYVKVGPHIHGICFGDPKNHNDRDFFIGIQRENSKNARSRVLRLETTQDVVGKVMYVLTHCGVSTLDKIIQPTRRYGNMYDYQVNQNDDNSFTLMKVPDNCFYLMYDPVWRDWFEKIWIPEKCREISELMGMAWDPDKGLITKDLKDDDKTVWLPIWKLYHFRTELENNITLDPIIVDFFFEILDYMEKFGHPPPLYPSEKVEHTPLYWAGGYLTGLKVPQEIHLYRDQDTVEIEEVVNKIEPIQEDDQESERSILLGLLGDQDPDVRRDALAKLKALKINSKAVTSA